MPEPGDITWAKATANELNNLLQVISESSETLESMCPSSVDSAKYFAILRNGVERAIRVAAMMSDRLGGGAFETAEIPRVSVAPKPSATPPAVAGDIRIANPKGPRELVLIVD